MGYTTPKDTKSESIWCGQATSGALEADEAKFGIRCPRAARALLTARLFADQLFRIEASALLIIVESIQCVDDRYQGGRRRTTALLDAAHSVGRHGLRSNRTSNLDHFQARAHAQRLEIMEVWHHIPDRPLRFIGRLLA